MKHKHSRRKNKRNLFGVGLISFVVIAVGLLIWTSESRTRGGISFNQAMAGSSETRQNFAEKVVKKIGKPDYIINVEYIFTPEQFAFLKEEYKFVYDKPTTRMVTLRRDMTPDEWGKGVIPVRIAIFPSAFNGDVWKTEADFIHALSHEYRHAEVPQTGEIGQFKIIPSFLTNQGRWNENLFSNIMELDAVRTTLLPKENASLSRTVVQSEKDLYLRSYLNIWNHSKDMDPGFISQLKIEFFDDWLMNSPKLDDLRHPNTKVKYALSEEEIKAIRQKWRR